MTQEQTIADDVKKLIADAANDPTPTTGQDVADFLSGAPTPTPDDARQMFAETPGLWMVITTEGRLYRNGVLEAD